MISRDHPLSLTPKLIPSEGKEAKIPLEGYVELEVPARVFQRGAEGDPAPLDRFLPLISGAASPVPGLRFPAETAIRMAS